jgi:hypothetical protein
MAITFFERRKRQRYLIVAFIVIIIAILLVIWFSRQKVGQEEVVLEIPKPQKIEINFEVLKDTRLENLQPFSPIPALSEEEIGRENPFEMYSIEEITKAQTEARAKAKAEAETETE